MLCRVTLIRRCSRPERRPEHKKERRKREKEKHKQHTHTNNETIQACRIESNAPFMYVWVDMVSCMQRGGWWLRWIPNDRHRLLHLLLPRSDGQTTDPSNHTANNCIAHAHTHTHLQLTYTSLSSSPLACVLPAPQYSSFGARRPTAESTAIAIGITHRTIQAKTNNEINITPWRHASIKQHRVWLNSALV